MVEQERVVEWNMSVESLKTLAMADRAAFQARTQRDPHHWYDIMKGVFTRVAPRCWTSQKDEEFTEYKSILEEVGDLLYNTDNDDPDDQQERESKALDLLDKFEMQLNKKMFDEEVTYGKSDKPDPYNNP